MAGISPWEYAKDSEHSHQAALFMWANMACRFGYAAAGDVSSYKRAGVAAAYLEQYRDQVTQLKWLHAIHNQGHGDKIRGAQAKAEGTKAGVYDLFLPVPMHVSATQAMQAYPKKLGFAEIWTGLYLELKVGTNKPSAIQNEFGADMATVGYATEVAWGWLEARNKLLAYLGLPLYRE